MTELLIILTFPERVAAQYLEPLRATFPELTVNLVDHHSKIGPYIGTADVLLTFGPMINDDVVRPAKNLKWFQALGSGVDNIVDLPSLAPDVVVTNLHGIQGTPVSEAALMAMLALSRGFPRVIRNQVQHRWDRFPARLLDGKTAGILGVGVIAEALAPKLKVMGMTVVGITGTPRPAAGFDRMHHRDEMVEVVCGLDHFILLAPYTPATRGIVGAEVLAAMKPDSYLINLARGGVVDEAALLATLQQGKIAGAALDVFGEEPLPGDHPFWALENVILTPHLGGFCDVYVDHALPVVTENMRRFLAGDAANMINIVKR
jgi:phosphoglycerate dehydrogenase-like enzyme